MATDITISDTSVTQQLAAYRITALKTEDGGDSSVLTKFSWSGKSDAGYSFGLYQYDVKTNLDAQSTLQKLGFTSDQITQLKSSGGIDGDTLNALSDKLKTALGTPDGQTTIGTLQSTWESHLTDTVQTLVDNSDQAITAQILSDLTCPRKFPPV